MTDTSIDPATGQQKEYSTLNPEERVKLKEPIRTKYVHELCGTLTKMGSAIAETYAADPSYYTGTFCAGCKKHFSFNHGTTAEGRFYWDGTNILVGRPTHPNDVSGLDTSLWLASGKPDEMIYEARQRTTQLLEAAKFQNTARQMGETSSSPLFTFPVHRPA